MTFELNKEYKLRLVQVSEDRDPDNSKIIHWVVKRVKIVAAPMENEMVIEFPGAKRYYLGIGLPVRGRLHMKSGVPQYLLSGNEKFQVMNVLS